MGGKSGGGQVQQAPKTAPAVQMEDAGVKAASDRERKRIAQAYGRNRTVLGAGVLVPQNNNPTSKQTLG